MLVYVWVLAKKTQPIEMFKVKRTVGKSMNKGESIIFLSIGLSLSWVFPGVRTACWWAAVWATTTGASPSSALWWATPATTNARLFSAAAACLQSVPVHICTYLVRNSNDLFMLVHAGQNCNLDWDAHVCGGQRPVITPVTIIASH